MAMQYKTVRFLNYKLKMEEATIAYYKENSTLLLQTIKLMNLQESNEEPHFIPRPLSLHLKALEAYKESEKSGVVLSNMPKAFNDSRLIYVKPDGHYHAMNSNLIPNLVDPARLSQITGMGKGLVQSTVVREAASEKETVPTNEDVNDKFIWNTDTTRLLISLRQDKTKDFNSGRYTKKAIWTDIAKKFSSEAGMVITWEQAKGKFVKLERKFKEIKLINQQSGSGRKDFLYEREMEECVGESPSIQPHYVVESGKRKKDESDEKESEQGKKKRKSESIVELLKDMREERKERDERQEKVMKEMHNDKCKLMGRFLDLFESSVKGDAEKGEKDASVKKN